MSQRLDVSSLTRLPASVQRPRFARASVRRGVVHLGPGAFHRAHQAQALDDILSEDPRWGIVGVSLHSAGVRDALAPQDGLYTLALLDEEVRYRVIGSVLDVLVAPEYPEAVLAALCAPEAEIATLTITEKGYCLGKDGALDLSHADVLADIANPAAPRTAMGFIAAAAKRRRKAGLKPLVVICCDNLSNNGAKLKRAVAQLAGETDKDLAAFVEDEMAFPGTMVDSITPATDDALRARVAGVLGVEDAWPIQREAFTQWVMERHVHPGGPDWAAGGVTLTDDVSAFERAKLRVLNASHSALAYLGSLKGHETVRDAMSDAELAQFVEDFQRGDVSPSLKVPAGFDLAGYCAAVRERFRNPEIRHLLAQIAWDGSQKLPIRVLSLAQEALEAGRPVARMARIVAAWLVFLRKKAMGDKALTDPMAAILLDVASQASGDAARDVGLFLKIDAVFPAALAASAAFRDAVEAAYAELLNRV